MQKHGVALVPYQPFVREGEEVPEGSSGGKTIMIPPHFTYLAPTTLHEALTYYATMPLRRNSSLGAKALSRL